jgi:hypothetical protein
MTPPCSSSFSHASVRARQASPHNISKELGLGLASVVDQLHHIVAILHKASLKTSSFIKLHCLDVFFSRSYTRTLQK